MLTNKKFVRMLALVIALLMTVAVFAGCSDKAALEEAQAQADAAEQAAKDAQAQADKAAADAAEAAAKLEQAIKDLQASQEQNMSDIKDSIQDAQSEIDHWHGSQTAAPSVTEAPIIEEDFTGVTDEVLKNEKLKAYTEMYTMYITDRADWYTSANYAKLVKIFEEAAFELYRATTADGIDQVIAEASAAAAAVDSIVSDAAKVQALIDAFGNVETEIFTTNDDKVEAARAAFDNWVETYEIRFFVGNACPAIVYDAKGELVIAGNEKALVDFARKLTNNLVYINIKDDTNSLLYAEAKVAQLYEKAEEAIYNEMVAQLIISGDMSETAAKKVVDVLFDENATQVQLNEALASYKAVSTLVEKYGVTYAECAANGKLIEDAYTAYRIFWNNNGGDDTPISAIDSETLLTGEQFVKLYVLTLYNGELNEYQNVVKDYLYDYVIEYFMNTDNTSTIKTATGWDAYLQIATDYITVYNATGAEGAWSLLDEATFAVQEDAIDIYVGGVKVDSLAADGVKIEKDFNRVAAKAATAIFALDYDKDFKGNKSLEDAFVEIDQIIVESMCEIAQVYYDCVVAPCVLDALKTLDAELAASYGAKKMARVDDYYKAYDAAFYANLSKMIADAVAFVEAYEVPTYAQLNEIADSKAKIKNIEDQKMFTVLEDAQGVFNGVELYTGDANGNNSAMKTVLAKFDASMVASAKTLYNKIENIMDAVWFHELKIDYAEALDSIVGIAKAFDDGEVDGWNYDSLLADDYYATIQNYMGKEDDKWILTEQAIYNATNAARNPARDAIMALEFINYETLEAIYELESYQAMSTDKKSKALYYDANGEITTTAKNNTALNVIVDREVVANNAIATVFASGADTVVKAFADLARAKVQANLSAGKALYEKNYSFGDKDPVGVFLEADMDAYIEYLNSLTGLSAITAFKVADFSLVNDKIAASGTVDALATYVIQTVYDSDGKVTARIPHITMAGVDSVEEITGTAASAEGYYNDLTTTQLDAFFALNAADACARLEDVRQLAYLKDSLLNGNTFFTVDGNQIPTLNLLKTEILGVWDATANDWKTVFEGMFPVDKLTPAAGYDYEMGTARTEVYLYQFDAAFARVTEAVKGITMLHEDVLDAAAADQYDVAEDLVISILMQAIDTTVDYDESDDMSLLIVYTRYYAIGQYDWSAYDAEVNG